MRRDALVLLLDADFVPNQGLHSKLTTGPAGASLLEMRLAWEQQGERQAMILPAFEHLNKSAAGTDCAAAAQNVNSTAQCFTYNGIAVPACKPKLSSMLATGEMGVFHEASVRAR